MKKLLSLLIAAAVMFGISVCAFAAGEGGSGGVDAGAVVIGAVVGIIIAVVVMLCLKGQLKSVHFQHAARSYIKDGLKLTCSDDIYLYKKVEKTELPKNDD
ncbi:MAG: hypothetical protein ACI4KA_04685 [Oscillospiraceae bacterium]